MYRLPTKCTKKIESNASNVNTRCKQSVYLSMLFLQVISTLDA